jgi:CP family cyanate transporter-like MFS transporter
VWFAAARHGEAASVVRSAAPVEKRSLLRSPLAWVITVFFGLQSLFAYTVMGWLPAMLVDSGVDRNTAGMLLAGSMLLSIPVSLFVPPIAARFSSQAPVVLALKTIP